MSRLADLEADAFLVTRLPNVRYLTGFTGSSGQLMVTADSALFLTDGRYREQSRREVRDVRRVIYSGELAPAFSTAVADLGVQRVAFESTGLTHKTYTDLSRTGVELVATTNEVERLRWVKDAQEIAAVEQAQRLADDAFDQICDRLVEGRTEEQVAFELDLLMREAGSSHPSFDTIVAFGENAAEPHHRPADRPLARGDVVKIDFGGVVDGYHSDMTRTVAFGGPTRVLVEVYDVVRRAQEAGIAALRSGITGGEADGAARAVVREAGFGENFLHSLGHGVGLEVHEGPSLRADGRDVVPEGAVVTVEPGVYLEGVGGVRIEDMVEVQANGSRVIPKATKELVVLGEGR